MSLTKYIVPAAMIVGGFFTGGATWATGAMMAGGAIMAVGEARGSKDLITAGSLIGTVGGVGAAMTEGPSIYNQLGSDSTSALASDTGAITNAAPEGNAGVSSQDLPPNDVLMSNNSVGKQIVNSQLGVDGGIDSSPLEGTVNGNQFTNADGTGTVAGTPQAQSNLAAISQLKKYSLISGALQGAGQAIGARTNADIQAQTQANQLAYQKTLSDRANSVGAVPSIVSPTGMLANTPAQPPQLTHAL